MNRSLSSIVVGACGGFLATIPQTVAMEAVRQALPTRFPPRQVAEEVLALFATDGRPPRLSEPAWHLITAVSHFGFGTAAGAGFGLLPKSTQRRRGNGVLFGLGVWAFSYGVIFPAVNIWRPQADRPVRKNLQLIAAHVAWGLAIDALFPRLHSYWFPLARTREKWLG